MQRGKGKGRISVRRMQMKLLGQGNATMGVWLGKALLGQREEVINDIRKIRSWSDLRLEELQALQTEMHKARDAAVEAIEAGSDTEMPEVFVDLQAARSMTPNEDAAAAYAPADRSDSLSQGESDERRNEACN